MKKTLTLFLWQETVLDLLKNWHVKFKLQLLQKMVFVSTSFLGLYTVWEGLLSWGREADRQKRPVAPDRKGS